MKKKGILIFVVLLLSISAIFLAKEMQKKIVNSEVANVKETKALQSNLKESSNDDSLKKNDNEKLQKTDNNSEIKEESKEGTKTQENSNNSSKSTSTSESSKQSTEKSAAPTNNSINKSSGSNNSTSPNNTQNSNSSTQQNQNNNLPHNFIISDTVTGKVIVSKHIDFNGETVANITKQNTDYKVKSGDYFYEIAGLKERSAGALSGWCYFINGSKPGIGAGSYVLKKDDVIEWKFLKDGVNN